MSVLREIGFRVLEVLLIRGLPVIGILVGAFIAITFFDGEILSTAEFLLATLVVSLVAVGFILVAFWVAVVFDDKRSHVDQDQVSPLRPFRSRSDDNWKQR